MVARFAVLLSFVAAIAVAQEPTKLPTFLEESRVNNVTVDVQVRDKDGAPVTGLGIDDFKIIEDGGLQKTTKTLVAAMRSVTERTSDGE